MAGHIFRAAAAALALLLAVAGVADAAERCRFDDESLAFEGTPAEQAACLLRRVVQWGEVAETPTELPSPLDRLVGAPFAYARETMSLHVAAMELSDREVGGSLSAPLSRARNGSADAPLARYFVIHDTSTPNYETDDFPADIDAPGWRYAELDRWDQGDRSKAHAFVNRVGASLSPIFFDRPWRATKLELRFGSDDVKGLFLHVELVQPRRSKHPGPAGNDAVAPDPGFTDAQYARLALLYAVASARRGTWLVPAFHAVLDTSMPDAHDDPQAFSLDAWARHLDALIEKLDELERRGP